MTQQGGRILFIPHGGGPLPLLGDPGHAALVKFLQQAGQNKPRPDAIVVISAHWEQPVATLTSNPAPSIIYDYGGFPEESYAIEYPAPGEPALAQQIAELLQQHNIAHQLDARRGFDHGLFVPLKLMYPAADIPCLQLSLLASLDAAAHIELGRALQPLLNKNILLLGSGFSFHNLRAFFAPMSAAERAQNLAFEDWLIDSCCNPQYNFQQREQRLIDWRQAPHARYCHPREEHLLPLHVCVGAAQKPAELVFADDISGVRSCALSWDFTH